jgi:hypothetical protein
MLYRYMESGLLVHIWRAVTSDLDVCFSRHCNMVLEQVKEMWTEMPKTGKGNKLIIPIILPYRYPCWTR